MTNFQCRMLFDARRVAMEIFNSENEARAVAKECYRKIEDLIHVCDRIEMEKKKEAAAALDNEGQKQEPTDLRMGAGWVNPA